jgi:hypothetical protein
VTLRGNENGKRHSFVIEAPSEAAAAIKAYISITGNPPEVVDVRLTSASQDTPELLVIIASGEEESIVRVRRVTHE